MTDYILEPLDTDAEVIFQNFVEYVQETFPDWQASEGQLDVIIARYFSMQTALTADMASRVLRAIYRYFGSSLAGIPPLPGTAAQAVVHFVIEDPLDPPVARTMEFGALVVLTDPEGDGQIFSLMDDLEVAAGQTDAEVEVQATELGSSSNAITGTVELVEQADWIRSATVVGVSSGGSDPEDDELYIQRLTENLALMAPRPILAEDFAVFAKNIPGVWRAAVIDNYRAGIGGAYTTDLANSIAISAVDQEGNPLPDSVRDQLIAYLQSTRPQNFLITFVPPTYHDVDVTYVARALRGQSAESVRTQVDEAITAYLSPASWGVYPYQSASRVWLQQPDVRYLELTTIVEITQGVDYTESLTFSLDGGALDTANKSFSGAFALTRKGAINGIINLPV